MVELSMNKKKNIIFVGLPASGKTTIGKKIAKKLNYEFLDTDLEIERITGKKIIDLFKKEGELRFRSEETHALKRIKNLGLNLGPLVIATGGGIILKEENREILKKLGIIVYLKADVDTITERVSRNKNRPLLKNGNIKENLKNFLDEREGLYLDLADIIIDTGINNFEDIIYLMEEKIKCI